MSPSLTQSICPQSEHTHLDPTDPAAAINITANPPFHEPIIFMVKQPSTHQYISAAVPSCRLCHQLTGQSPARRSFCQRPNRESATPSQSHHAPFALASSLPSFLGYSLTFTPSTQHSLATTTVSRFFTDKVGAAPQDPASEDSPSPATTAPPRRPGFLHRLHIHSSAKKPKPPALTIRPSTSSSLPVRSSSPPRLDTSHSDAATIAEITSIMPQSLTLGTPPQASNKRQRSRESRKEPSRPGSAGQTAPSAPPNDYERLARSGVRLPSYLNKTKTGTLQHFLFPVSNVG